MPYYNNHQAYKLNISSKVIILLLLSPSLVSNKVMKYVCNFVLKSRNKTQVKILNF